MQMLGRRDSQPQQEPQTPPTAAKGEGKTVKGAGNAAKGKNAAAPQQHRSSRQRNPIRRMTSTMIFPFDSVNFH